MLPEGYMPPRRDTAVELARCQQYIASRQHPQTEYVSPQRRIEELEAANLVLEADLVNLARAYGRCGQAAAAMRSNLIAVGTAVATDGHYYCAYCECRLEHPLDEKCICEERHRSTCVLLCQAGAALPGAGK